MNSNFYLIALVFSPIFFGWVAQRTSYWFLTVAAVYAAGVTAYFLLSYLESSWMAEYYTAIAPFDLDSDGVLEGTELNDLSLIHI